MTVLERSESLKNANWFLLGASWHRRCVLGLLGLFCAPAWAMASSLQVVGGADIVWAIRDMSEGEGAPSLWRFGYRRVGPADQTFWGVAVRGIEVVGDPRVAAVRGSRLHVWYADGTHRGYGPRRSGVERTLPGSAVPMAAGASDASSPVYAIVDRSVAMLLESAETGEDVTESRWLDSDYVVVRLDRGRWQGDRDLPRTWFGRPDEVHLLASGTSLGIVFSAADGAEGYAFVRSEGGSSVWSEPAVIKGLRTGDLLAAATCDGAPVLVVARDDGARAATLRLAEEGWIEGSVLTVDGAAIREPGRATFGVLGSEVVGAWVSDDDTVRSARWPVQGGTSIDGETTVRSLSPGPSARSSSGTRLFLAYVTLMLVLVAVFMRRRVSVVDDVKLPPHVCLVSHGRRMLAFSIDALLFMPAAAYVFVPLLRRFDFNEAMLRQATMVDGAVMREFTWRWVLVAAAFIVYATVFECWWRATPGKRLLRMCVLAESGGRCGFMRIVVRNVLRGVEFFPFLDLLPTLVLIFLTKNHQRLGDLMGRTVVVQRMSEPAPKREPADHDDS